MRVPAVRRPTVRVAAVATLIAALTLTACGGSDGDKKSTSPTGTPSGSGAPTSSAGKVNGFPLIIHGVTSKQNTALTKVVPLLPGVQNTEYDPSSKTLRVIMRATATAADRIVVISQLQKYTKKKAAVESNAPGVPQSSPAASSPSR